MFCMKHVCVYYSGRLRGESSDDLVAGDEGEKINTEIRKNVSHRPVGVCRATDHFSRNPREEKRCRKHRCLHLPVHLDKENKEDTVSKVGHLYSGTNVLRIVTQL